MSERLLTNAQPLKESRWRHLEGQQKQDVLRVRAEVITKQEAKRQGLWQLTDNWVVGTEAGSILRVVDGLRRSGIRAGIVGDRRNVTIWRNGEQNSEPEASTRRLREIWERIA